MVVGHGLRARTIEGPLSAHAKPVLTEVLTRRYECRACHAILVVVPKGVARSFRYSCSAIGWALALWGCQHATASSVRARTSTAQTVGASSLDRWASLRRWTRSALRLFGAPLSEHGTVRERAAAVASFVAAHALLPQGPLPADAFCGAAQCRSR